jgi:alpha-tubulin suppressor-like RCC1 family protein
MAEPTAIPFFERTRLNIRKIVCSDEQSCLLTSDGILYTWGRQYKGIDEKGKTTRSKPQIIDVADKSIK